MQQQSAEYNVTRTYLEWIADLPWSKTTPDKLDVEETRRCLDEDHFGLEKVKKRIVEYVAVRKLARRARRRPILCFIGPPGVGKTSLGRSIARSMGRRYHRIALGGVRDEAEIRGHRRTYVGALPGRILQGMKKVGVKNPVIVLDEVDKMGVDMLGDPAAALLEVLDPEQNSTFQDHYLDVPFDLSQVTFLAPRTTRTRSRRRSGTAWRSSRCPGYTRTEKLDIAREFLVPQAALARTASPTSASSSRADGLERHHRLRTRARPACASLEREIGVGVPARRDAHRGRGDDLTSMADAEARREDPRRRRATCPTSPSARARPGVATGLAWTPSGGDILFIEATQMPGKGEVARHRQPEERDERERGDGRVVRAQPREGPRPRPGVPQGDRPAPARAQGRDAEGRAERRRDDVQRGRVAAPPVRR